jgi:hypothetical protein
MLRHGSRFSCLKALARHSNQLTILTLIRDAIKSRFPKGKPLCILGLEQVFRCIAPGSMFSAALVAPGNFSNQHERETNSGLLHFSDWYRVLPQTSVGIFPEKMPIARLWVTLQKSEK